MRTSEIGHLVRFAHAPKATLPELVAALRRTLEHLERAEIVSPDAPVMRQLKASILRVLAQQELESETIATN
jgi:hypothetical protein